MPHLDPADRITRAYAAEQARKARIDADRAENARRIREQIEDGSAGIGGKSVHCGICGSPWGDRSKPRNACADCDRAEWERWARSKLSDEEIYPDE